MQVNFQLGLAAWPSLCRCCRPEQREKTFDSGRFVLCFADLSCMTIRHVRAADERKKEESALRWKEQSGADILLKNF